mmetsp:Transcript_11110/g.18186  ORF Transcript_11110/g.18186 Transcript_11110/m.18186 type:complete len:93 (-) Transcript_11110:91-369(-)
MKSKQADRWSHEKCYLQKLLILQSSWAHWKKLQRETSSFCLLHTRNLFPLFSPSFLTVSSTAANPQLQRMVPVLAAVEEEDGGGGGNGFCGG